MKIPISGYINNSDTNILLAEDIVEDFFEIYSVTVNGEKYIVEGILVSENEVTTFIDLDGVGKIPVIIRKNNHHKQSGLFLSDKLKKDNKLEESRTLIQYAYDSDIIISENVDKPIDSEKQKQLFYEHVQGIVEDYASETVEVLVESMHNYVKDKITEHSASLLSEYLNNIEKVKPQLEQYVYDTILLNSKKIEESIVSKTNSLDKKIDAKLNEFKGLKSDIQSTLSDHLDTSNTFVQNLIKESTDKALLEIRESIDSNRESIKKLVQDAKKELLDENTINYDNSILELKKLNENHLNKTEEKIQEGVKTLVVENERLYDLVKQEKEDIIKEGKTQIKNIEEIKNNLLSIHSEQLASAKSIFINAETSLRNSFSDYTKELTEEFKKDIDSRIRTELTEAKKISRENEILKKDIKSIKSQLDSQFTQMRRYVEGFGGGGGTVAVQYAAGGTMNGNLDVNGNLEANAVSIQNVTFTNNLSTNVTSVTAMPEFLKIQVNGVDRYVRLFTVV